MRQCCDIVRHCTPVPEKNIPKGLFHYLVFIPPNEIKRKPSLEYKSCSKVNATSSSKTPRKETRYICAQYHIPLFIHPCFRNHHQAILCADAQNQDGGANESSNTDSD